MNVTIQQLVDMFTQQEPIDGWPPEIPPRPLNTFSDLLDVSPDEPTDRLRTLGSYYQNGQYTHIHQFLKDNPDQLGNEGKLLLVLAYLQIFRNQPDKLEGWTTRLVKELVASEPSEFANLYEWFQNFIQERPMPPAFYGLQGASGEDND